MGNCMAKGPTTKTLEVPNATVAAPSEPKLTPDTPVWVDGKDAHLRIVATESGRVLLSADPQPLAEEQKNKVLKVISENEDVAKKVEQLSMLADMGIKIRSSKSPAFLGLLVIDVESANLNAKKPWVQIRCEDDKGIFIKANASPTNDSTEVSLSEPSPLSASDSSEPPALQQISSTTMGSSSSGRRRDFTWADAKFVFVTAFSHSTFEVVLKEGAVSPGMPRTTIGTASVPVCKLRQGTHAETLTVMNGSKELGTVQLRVRYEWMRGTKDSGQRFYVDKVSVDARKLKGFRVLTHVSNVNHWLLSHDNVWAALEPDHPALRIKGKGSERSLTGLSAGGSSFTASTASGFPSSVPSGLNAGAAAAAAGRLTSVPESGERAAPSVDDRLEEGVLEDGELNTAALEDEPSTNNDDQGDPDGQGQNTNGNNSTASSNIFESTIADALALVDAADGANGNTLQLYQQLAGIFSLVNDRFCALESQVQQQGLLIQELEYRLDMKSGETVLPYITGRFGYGLGRPASKRRVLLFARRAQDSYVGKNERDCDLVRPGAFLGMYKTDAGGVLGPVEVPVDIATTPGHYNITALLPQDNTFAKGSLYILAPGTQCVVMDMDGTLTVGDQEVVAQFALNAVGASLDIADKALIRKYDLKQRHHSRTLARLWAAKGYQVVYLSGRQGSFYNLTMQWLINHNYPPGPIHLTRTRSPTLPVYLSVGSFKVAYMEMLKRKGFSIYAAYGNTGTDVRAYAAAGIPKERTYMVGQAAGSGGTVKIHNWTKHLVDVVAMPDASVPVPYIDVLWSDLPMYRSRADERRDAAITTVCGPISPEPTAAAAAAAAEDEEEEAATQLDTRDVAEDFEDEESNDIDENVVKNEPE